MKKELQYAVDEYLDAAEWCAVRGFKGKEGDPLPQNLSVPVHTAINADIKKFIKVVEEISFLLALDK